MSIPFSKMEYEERNKSIWTEWNEGNTLRVLGKKYSVSIERVRQIAICFDDDGIFRGSEWGRQHKYDPLLCLPLNDPESIRGR